MATTPNYAVVALIEPPQLHQVHHAESLAAGALVLFAKVGHHLPADAYARAEAELDRLDASAKQLRLAYEQSLTPSAAA
jgi:hypothetical protein